MKKIENHLKSQKNQVYMLQNEQEAIKAHILEKTASPYYKNTPSPISYFSYRHLQMALLVIFVLSVVSVPVTHAAQDSAPGDLLYGFEIHVVEEIEKLLYTSPQKRISYHTERLEERLEEMESVANTVNSHEYSTTIIKEISEHTEAVISSIEENQNKNNIDNLINISAIIEVQSEVLGIIQNQQTNQEDLQETLDLVAQKLNTEIDIYTKNVDDDEISDTITKNIEEINTLSDDVDAVLDQYTTNQLENISHEITEENWTVTLEIIADTKIEILKQNLLTDISI